MGGGVGLLDYDNDGRLDIFFTNGAKIDDPMPDGKRPDKSDPRFWNRLYRQKEDGAFIDVTAKAGLTGMPQNHYGMGIAVGDYDNDGFTDLYVTNYGGNTLYRNNGRRHVRRRHQERRRRRRRMERERRLLRCRQRRQARPLRHPLPGLDLPGQPLLRREETRLPRLLPSRQLQRDRQHPVSQQRRRDIRGRVREGGRRRCERQRTWRRVRRLRRRRVRGRVRRERLGAVVPVSQQGEEHVCRGRPADRRRVQRGRQDVCRHGCGLRRLRQRRPLRHRRHGSLERALPALSAERRSQLPGRDEHVRRGRGHASVLGLEHAVLRLRQRRLEGHLRRAGTRDGHDREDGAEPEIPAAAVTAAERGRTFRESAARRQFSEGLGRPGRGVRRSGQRRRHRRGGQQRRPEGLRAAQRRRESRELARDPDDWQDVEPRWDRVSSEGRVRVRNDSVLHRQHGCRVSLGQ